MWHMQDEFAAARAYTDTLKRSYAVSRPPSPGSLNSEAEKEELLTLVQVLGKGRTMLVGILWISIKIDRLIWKWQIITVTEHSVTSTCTAIHLQWKDEGMLPGDYQRLHRHTTLQHGGK